MKQENLCKPLSICFVSLFVTEDVEAGPRC